MRRSNFITFYKKAAPPERLRFPVIILLGIIFGMGIFIIYISNAASYLSDKPATCINCHVMVPQFATWERGSHGKVATCNDCHVPQDNFFRKYYFKAADGLRHATMFTLRMEPQVMRIGEMGKSAVQENCIRCHTNQIHPLSLKAISGASIVEDGKYCWDCHRATPHGRVNSLSSTPYARTPVLTPIMPEWLDNFMNSNPDKK